MSNSTRYPLSSTPASELSEQGPNNMLISNTTPSPSPSRPIRTSLQGPLAILWDIENCPVPNGVRPEDVAGNIRMALRVHPVIDGAITLFSAYGDFNAFPRRLREGCQRTGVKLVDVPNGRKDAADKAILVDMFLFALDNPPPSSIMLISGDVDFAPALHILGQRGYTVILVIPSNVGVSSALSNAGRFVWDWPSIVRGEGFVPLSRAPIPRAEIPKISLGCQMSCNMEGQNEEGSVVYRGVSKNYYNSRDFSIVSHSQSEFSSSSSTFTAQNPATSRSYSVPSGLSEVTFSQCDQNGLSWVQPGDLNVLKGQLVKLLEMSGGSLPLTRLPSDYQKTYGRPLYVSEFGALKLVHLLHKMSDEISVQGQGQRKIVCLCSNSKSVPVGPTVILARRDNRNGKGVQEGNVHGTGTGSSDEFSEEERAITNENGCDSRNIDQNVDKFKYELQEILVSYGCRILLGCFEEIYQQRYKRQLDYLSFGVNQLEELLEKVKDVVGLQEDETTRCKFLVAERF